MRSMNRVVFALVIGLGLVGCLLQPAATPTPLPTPTATAPPVTPTVPPTDTATSIPASSTPTPTDTPTPIQTAQPSPTSAGTITVTPKGASSLPVGASATFGLEIASHPTDVSWKAENVPAGITTRFMGNPAPYGNELVVTSDPSTAPGRYTITVSAYQGQTLIASAPAPFTLTACVEAQPGEFTQSIKANTSTIITAGKPSYEKGLIVPVQICQPTHLRVDLKQVVSEGGAVLTDPPPFYLYRSIVYPAPGSIQAAPSIYWMLNVELPRVNNTSFILNTDVAPGLYLLIFQSDAYPGNPDPPTHPDMVTYDLQIGP